jgi:hypothetical protein
MPNHILCITRFWSMCALLIGLTSCTGNTTARPTSLASTPMLATATLLQSTPILATPTAIDGQAIFVGHYRMSFEVSSFVPCTLPGLPGYGLGYWLEADPNSGFYEHYQTMISASRPTPTVGYDIVGVIIFVRFVGQLSPPSTANGSGYGHLGMYQHQITVKRLLEMSPHTNNQCAS